MTKGKLFIISGASGVGKSTVLHRVMEQRKDLSFSVSATTRPPRPGEVEGKSYYFVTKERFEDMIAQNAFVEYDAHMGNYYGTLKSEIINKTKTGNMLLDIEPVGALHVQEIFPDATLIYIAPPSLEALEQRLRGRNDTSEEQMKLRRERAVWESAQMEKYDYVVVNDILDDCVQQVLHIIREMMEK